MYNSESSDCEVQSDECDLEVFSVSSAEDSAPVRMKSPRRSVVRQHARNQLPIMKASIATGKRDASFEEANARLERARMAVAAFSGRLHEEESVVNRTQARLDWADRTVADVSQGRAHFPEQCETCIDMTIVALTQDGSHRGEQDEGVEPSSKACVVCQADITDATSRDTAFLALANSWLTRAWDAHEDAEREVKRTRKKLARAREELQAATEAFERKREDELARTRDLMNHAQSRLKMLKKSKSSGRSDDKEDVIDVKSDDDEDRGGGGGAVMCVICEEHPRGVVFIPCGHVLACQAHAQVLTKCPQCNSDVQSRLKIYLP